MIHSVHTSILAALLLAALPSTASAGDLLLVAGRAEVQGQCDAADWDTDQGFAESNFRFAGGGWGDDTQCAGAACVSTTSAVNTQGGAASTLSSATLMPLGGGQYLFPALSGQAQTDANASVLGIGILTDASSSSKSYAVLIATENMTLNLAGTSTGSASGSGSSAYSFVVVLDLQGNLLAGAGASCTPGAPCNQPFSQSFDVQAGQAYVLITASESDTSTGTSASAAADTQWTLSELPSRARLQPPAGRAMPSRTAGQRGAR